MTATSTMEAEFVYVLRLHHMVHGWIVSFLGWKLWIQLLDH